MRHYQTFLDAVWAGIRHQLHYGEGFVIHKEKQWVDPKNEVFTVALFSLQGNFVGYL